MKKIIRNIFRSVHLVMPVVMMFASYGISATPAILNPFRVLVIIGTQWQDPSGYLVEMPSSTGAYSGYGATPEVTGDCDFHHLMVLLKSWGIPFEIVRLDQQFLDRYMFLDMQNNPKFGTIIWDVNKSDKLLPQDYSLITEMVKEHGIGLIALSDRIFQPEIQSILGIQYTGSWESNSSMTIKAKHFLTENLISPFKIDSGIIGHIQRQQAVITEGTTILVEQGSYPQVTSREYPSGSHVVWIGNDHNYLYYFQSMRALLRRSITWTIGYNINKSWDNKLVMIMDDPGSAAGVWLEHWHYPELSEEIITKYMIGPLQKHNAVLNINFVPAFVNDQTKRLEPTWNESFTDQFGIKQDYISSKRGYDKGVKLGVFEVMSHGLTHMQPDLASDPAWYGSTLARERSEVGWYREFGDTRRNKEIPAAEQLWRMKTSRDWLIQQFGSEPLEFCPGGLGNSITYFNNTAKLAGEAGFGWNGWETGYLGRDLVITGWKFFGTSESPAMVAVLPDGHDFGISREPDKFAQIFDKYPNGQFISMNEFIGYLHAGNKGTFDRNSNKLSLIIDYDPHYCRYFENHESDWNIEFSDWWEKDFGKPGSVTIDGKAGNIIKNRIQIPRGTGQHKIEIILDKQ